MKKILLLLAFLWLPAQANIVMPGAVTTSLINVVAGCSSQSGVSPMRVVCSCVGSRSAAAGANPFHTIQCDWNFGDPNVTAIAAACGTPFTVGAPIEGFHRCGSNPGANSKNTASGPIVSHVYEITEGSGTHIFTVTPTLNDGTTIVAGPPIPITVTDPAVVYATTLTTCFYNTTLGSGCPTGATQTPTSAYNLSTCTTGRRCLFKIGDSFAAASSQSINVAGPITIGAYGVGVQPTVTSSGISGVIQLSYPGTSGRADVRMMDLNITGSGSSDTGVAILVSALNVTDPLILRPTIGNLTGGGIGQGIIMSGPGGGAINSMRGGVIADAVISGIYRSSGGVGIYGYAVNSSYTGNSVGPFGTPAEHNVRCQPCQMVGIANNTMTTPGNTGKSNLTIRSIEHSPNASDPNSYGVPPDTQYVHAGWNKMIAGTVTSQMVDAAPASNTQNDWGSDIIFDGNWLVMAGGVAQQAMSTNWGLVTMRNNICDASGGFAAGRTCFMNNASTNTAGVPAPDGDKFYNNTCYDSSASGGMDCVSVGAAGQVTTNNVVINNLGYAPSASSPHLLVTGAGSTVTASNNSTNGQVSGTSPNFTSVSPFNPTNAKPTSGYAVGGGTSVPVWSDFFRTLWSPTWSIGAVHP